jgi:FMN-dependent NADH-azoreductase
MILGFVGVTDIDFAVAEGTAHVDRSDSRRETYLKPIRDLLRAEARKSPARGY